MIGTYEIELQDVQALKIHETLYYQVTFTVPGQAQPQQMRINPEAFYPNPQPGDRVEVNMVMGTVMGAKKLG